MVKYFDSLCRFSNLSKLHHKLTNWSLQDPESAANSQEKAQLMQKFSDLKALITMASARLASVSQSLLVQPHAQLPVGGQLKAPPVPAATASPSAKVVGDQSKGKVPPPVAAAPHSVKDSSKKKKERKPRNWEFLNMLREEEEMYAEDIKKRKEAREREEEKAREKMKRVQQKEREREEKAKAEAKEKEREKAKERKKPKHSLYMQMLLDDQEELRLADIKRGEQRKREQETEREREEEQAKAEAKEKEREREEKAKAEAKEKEKEKTPEKSKDAGPRLLTERLPVGQLIREARDYIVELDFSVNGDGPTYSADQSINILARVINKITSALDNMMEPSDAKSSKEALTVTRYRDDLTKLLQMGNTLLDTLLKKKHEKKP